MKKEETKTHWKKLYNPNYLGSWSLAPGVDMILTIKTVTKEAVTGSDGKESECTIVQFNEDVKPLILNKTNAISIQKVMSTPYIEEWIGNRIQLYTTRIKAFGDMVEALRVRAKSPKKVEELTPNHEKWDNAIESLRKGYTTIDAIKKHYSVSDEHTKMMEDVA